MQDEHSCSATSIGDTYPLAVTTMPTSLKGFSLQNRLEVIVALTEVADVHDGVEPGLEEDEDSEELVDVDVVVERKEESEPELSEFGDHVAVNEQEDQAGVE